MIHNSLRPIICASTADAVMDLLTRTVRADGLTLVLVTHDPNVAARADRHVTIRDGRLVSDDRLVPVTAVIS